MSFTITDDNYIELNVGDVIDFSINYDPTSEIQFVDGDKVTFMVLKSKSNDSEIYSKEFDIVVEDIGFDIYISSTESLANIPVGNYYWKLIKTNTAQDQITLIPDYPKIAAKMSVYD